MEVISIVTICRNSAALLEATMLSVLTQTYPAIEYIVVDGLSSDHTLEIARGVASRFPERNIKIISEPDQGISDAMNKGVLMSGGTLVAHLHAGDRYINNKTIEKVMASFQHDGWRWGVAETLILDSEGRHVHVFRPHKDSKWLLKQNFIPHPSTFLVRDIFERHGYFRVDLKQAMDYEFWLRIVFVGGENYQVLPFATTYFQEGGRSSQLIELLKYLAVVRREIRDWNPKMSIIDDASYYFRVVAYSVFIKLKHVLLISK